MAESILGGDEKEFMNDLGMTSQRLDELIRITNVIMSQETPVGGYGRTSHVLLGITGRKDLTDLEKTVCTLIFSTRVLTDMKMKKDDFIVRDINQRSPLDNLTDIMNGPLSIPRIESKTSDSMIIGPPGIELREMLDILMTFVVSLIEKLPKEESKEFCRKASIKLAKMSVIGDRKG